MYYCCQKIEISLLSVPSSILFLCRGYGWLILTQDKEVIEEGTEEQTHEGILSRSSQ